MLLGLCMNLFMKNNLAKNTVFYLLAILITIAVFTVCVLWGSTGFSLAEVDANTFKNVIFDVRLPRVVCVALIGAMLSICGAAMQGLLRNPLADGTTLGVSSGGSLGAVIAIILSSLFPFVATSSGKLFSVAFSMLFSFLSLILIINLARKVDARLSTNTIILVGVVFSMFASSFISLLVSLFPQNAKTVTFWTMGSVSGANIEDCFILIPFFVIGSLLLVLKSKELNIFAIGEENASHLGVDVRKSKLTIMIIVAALVGVSVSVAGTIGFVGLVVPHICRMIIGPNHKKLLPFTIFFGASFLMLTDLISRIIIAPKELPIGVITSLIGAIVFVIIFYRQRKGAK